MTDSNQYYRGRGASSNPENRFKRLNTQKLPGEQEGDHPTEYFVDQSETILAENNSPDIPFTYSLNPYRGCEHGCIYCYARPSHEYLDFSPGLDFESKIVVKENAPELLEKRFESGTWEPQVISLSGNTDPYQPIERELELTRSCLKVFRRYRNPVSLITKSQLVTRDIDVLSDLADANLVRVHVSITSLDRELINKLEPRTTRPHRRLDAIDQLSNAGIPVGVNAAPMIPGLTDQELPSILREASRRGATSAGYIMVRLPGPVKDLFSDWLEQHFPDRRDKVLNQIRSVRDGTLNDSTFGDRMQGSGEHADFQKQLFDTLRERHGLDDNNPTLDTSRFTPNPDQRSLF
ncbi:MAG: PA0069 family radical SAM protein [bacterium]